MKRLLWILPLFLLGAAPSRTQTYVSGEVIDPADVTENEDNIFSYLQAGADTIRANAVESGDLQDASVTAAKIAVDAVTTAAIASGAVAADEIATDAVGAAEIAADAVGTSEIATDGVESAEIAANAVGASEIAVDSVALTTDTTGNYAAGDAEAGNATGLVCTNCVAGTEIALGSDAQGDVYYYDGTDVARLGVGTSGQFLKTQGASANPVWASAQFSDIDV